MKKPQKAMHLDTVRRTYKDKTYETHLLRHTYREDGKVRHETLANLSCLPPHAIEALRLALKGHSLAPVEECFEIRHSLPHGHVRAVLTAFERLGLAKLIASQPSRERDLILGLIAARILEPGSKLATTRWWQTCTLASELGISDATEDEVYAAMDWLIERQDRIEKKLAARHLSNGGLVLYDLSSSYVTGTQCELASLGYSRDRKRGTLQVNYGLLTDAVGRPVAISLYPGNTVDSVTLTDQVTVLKGRFSLESVVLVGDRGMISQTQIDALKETEGVDWVTALKSPAIRKLLSDGAIQMSLFDERNLFSLTHPDYPGEHLVACRNPDLAKKRAHVREDLIASTSKLLAAIRKRVASGKLRGQAAIGLEVGEVVNKYKVRKHFILTIEDDGFEYEVDAASVAEEAALDGLYVIRTSLSPQKTTAAEAVLAYKRLTQVERAFRSLKTVDLKVRPIYHHLVDRVAAHLFVCMLAYYVEWHLREAWAPLLFDDEEAPAADRDPVAPVKRSESAKIKAQTRTLPDGTATHSFQTLLQALSTLTRNRCALPGNTETFVMDTLSSELHTKAFSLLDRIAV